jgi:hypothetical protein
MQTDTYSNLLTLVKALSGNTSLTPQEETLIGSFINRRIYNAYRRSSYWPRYMVLGEARAASSNVIPFDQVTLNSIDTFLRIYDQQPYLTNSVDEFEFVVTYDGARVLVTTTTPPIRMFRLSSSTTGRTLPLRTSSATMGRTTRLRLRKATPSPFLC